MSNGRHNIELIDFSDEFSNPIKAHEWVEKYFRV